MSNRVLITGATGFVGFHLIEHCLQAGYEVYAAIRSNSDTSHLKDYQINYLELDYADPTSLSSQLGAKRLDYIIHAAGSTKARTEADYNLVNAEYTRNLAIAVNNLSYPIKKFVFVSSLAAIGPLHDIDSEIQDNSIPHPVTNYGKSKILAEKYLSEIKGLPIITIRPTAVYGPREKDLFILFKTIKNGIEPYIGKFNQQLSFIYVKDLAKVIVGALESNVQPGNAYNISDGKAYDRYALALFIKKAMAKKTLIFHLPLLVVSSLASFLDMVYSNSKKTPTLNKEKMAELTAINWVCSIQEAKKDLGFSPVYDLESGLAETVSWYKKNNWL
ncbi:NAD-dependent epimerase/dehydratase family protein [Pedobacter sp. PWIIR3]